MYDFWFDVCMKTASTYIFGVGSMYSDMLVRSLFTTGTYTYIIRI